MMSSDYRVERIRENGPAFDEAYAVLDREFGPRGELERRSVVAGWLQRGAAHSGGFDIDHHLLVVRNAADALCAVRDCHTVVDRAAGCTVLYLAHVLVLPEYRQHGIARLLRDAPLAVARDLMPEGDIIVVAEMEHPRREDQDSIVRLLAYGRAGFAAVDPRALPYWQPDFSDPDAIDEPKPVPLLLVVNHLDHHAASLSKRLARASVTQLYAVFASHCRAAHLAPLQSGMLSAIDAWPEPELPLVTLPTHLEDEAALGSLARPSSLTDQG